MTTDIKLSQLVRSQLPAHIRNNYETFTRFLEVYYEWLEQKSNPTDVIRNWNDYSAVSTDIDEFIDALKSETLHSVPAQILADKRRLALHAREIYKAKGTEKSFKFLFRVLFNEDIELYYPKNNIFRLSEGSWNRHDRVLVTSSVFDPVNYLYKTIRQTRRIDDENTEEASAIVVKAQRSYDKNVVRNVFHLGNVKGVFKDTHPIHIDDEEYTEQLYPIVCDLKIVNGGTGYQKGDLIRISDAGDWVISRPLPFSKVFDTGVTSLIPALEIQVSVNGVPTTEFTYDGRFITLPSFTFGDNVSVLFPKTSGYAIVSEVSGNGAIAQVKIFEFPVGHQTIPTYTIQTSQGVDAVLNIEVGLEGFRPGYYSDEKGFLSANNYLHDGNYYQDFSYVIQASHSIDSYAGFVKKLLHPAGMKLFGEIRVLSMINMIIKNIVSYISTEPNELDITASGGGDMHAITSDVDWLKLTLDAPLSSFGDISLSNIETSYGRRWNVAVPTILEITYA